MRLPLGPTLALQRDQQKAREPDFDRVKRDQLELVGGVAQPVAKEVDGVARELRILQQQPVEFSARQRVRGHGRKRHRRRRAWLSIEHRDLADDFAGLCHPDAQFAPFARHDREADLTAADQVKRIAGIAALIDGLAALELRGVKPARDLLQRVRCKHAEQLGLREQQRDWFGG